MGELTNFGTQNTCQRQKTVSRNAKGGVIESGVIESGVIERLGIVYNHGRTRHASGTDLANPVGSEAGRFGHNIQRLGRAGGPCTIIIRNGGANVIVPSASPSFAMRMRK
jgi:hypothetical protein